MNETKKNLNTNFEMVAEISSHYDCNEISSSVAFSQKSILTTLQ